MDNQSVTLLNGETWKREVILERMLDDDFYYGHLGKYALSASSCKLLLGSPKSYYMNVKYGQKIESPALTMGKVIHTIILEPHLFDARFEVVNVKSKTTKAYKEASAGSDMTVITSSDYSAAKRVADAVRNNEYAMQYINDSEYEVPAIGELFGSIPFRAKADILNSSGGFIADVKTTTEMQSGFKYSARKYGYDMQAYLYTELFGFRDFVFIAVDKSTLDVGIYTVSDQFLFDGEQKVELAMNRFKKFFIDGEDLNSYTILDEL